jgi:hypothetical protein
VDVGFGFELTGSKDHRKYNNKNVFFIPFCMVVKNKWGGYIHKFPGSLQEFINRDFEYYDNNNKITEEELKFKDFIMDSDKEGGLYLYYKEGEEKHFIKNEPPAPGSSGVFGNGSTNNQKTVVIDKAFNWVLSKNDGFLNEKKLMWNTAVNNGYNKELIKNLTYNPGYLFEGFFALFFKMNGENIKSIIGGREFDGKYLWFRGSLLCGVRGIKYCRNTLLKIDGSSDPSPWFTYQNDPIILRISPGYKWFGILLDLKLIELIYTLFAGKFIPSIKFGFSIILKFVIISFGWDFDHRNPFISIAFMHTINAMGTDRITKKNINLAVKKNHQAMRMNTSTPY